MTRNPIKFLFHLFLYILYRKEKHDEYLLYLLAEEKGMFCCGWDMHTGIAEFNPNKPPQNKPTKITFKEFMTRINKWVL